jgi:hypothetical protein
VAGFAHCRPVISVDGTFLTGKYKGTLIVDVGMTTENQLVPLAFALVEGENNESWKWLFGLVRKQVLGPDRQVCMISDRHRGLLNGAKDHLQGTLHLYTCGVHVILPQIFGRINGARRLSPG